MWRAKFSFKFGGVEVYFGPGVLRENLNKVIANRGKALVISSRTAARVSDALSDVVRVLEETGVDYKIYDRVVPNPYTHVVDEVVEVAESEGVEVLVAIGGGSVIDVSKAASLLVGTGIKAAELVRGKRPARRGVRASGS